MENVPTAEEIEISGNYDSYQDMMRAFAKLHVKAALEAAANNAKATQEFTKEMISRKPVVNRQSILSAYPLTNIK